MASSTSDTTPLNQIESSAEIPESTEGDTVATMKGAGSAVVFHTSNVPKWLKVFEEYYFNRGKYNSDTNCDWAAGPPITTIKYDIVSTGFSLKITIWHNTGTISGQGPVATLETYLYEHYPILAAIRTRLELSDVEDSIGEEEDRCRIVPEIDLSSNAIHHPSTVLSEQAPDPLPTAEALLSSHGSSDSAQATLALS